MSEWAREVLLRELDGRQARPADETLLAEVLALRTILLNLHFTVAKGETITAEGMHRNPGTDGTLYWFQES